ncbi:cytochrome c oxidase assembly factor 3 homolog, mitochondrial [Salmo trutta]|nr:cytochrome c oxidase assembly factor 3 homolog, mitochondrial-like [Salmo trutta]
MHQLLGCPVQSQTKPMIIKNVRHFYQTHNNTEMAAEGVGEVASKEQLSAAQKQLLRKRQDLDYWKKNALKIRSRNRITGLAIGAFVIGMFSYTILSVKQERIMEDIDNEAKIKYIRGPRTGTNS